MRILVTGGAGYIGSVLVPDLLAAGHEVHVLDDFRYGQDLALAACAYHPNFNLTVATLPAASRQLAELVSWAEAIIPLAALVGAPLCAQRLEEAYDVNHHVVRTISRMAGPRWIIYPNTNSGYGRQPGICTEESPLVPLSGYAESKQRAEEAVMSRSNSVTLRLATVFGMSPRMRMDLLVNDFVWRAVTDGYLVLYEPNARRNYVHVRDVARAFLHVLTNLDTMKNQIYNVGLPDCWTKGKLADRIKGHVGEHVTVLDSDNREDPDQRDYEVSSNKLIATGFEFNHSIDDGVVELIKGFAPLRRARYGNV